MTLEVWAIRTQDPAARFRATEEKGSWAFPGHTIRDLSPGFGLRPETITGDLLKMLKVVGMTGFPTGKEIW